jgi:hypothetical protein
MCSDTHKTVRVFDVTGNRRIVTSCTLTGLNDKFFSYNYTTVTGDLWILSFNLFLLFKLFLFYVFVSLQRPNVLLLAICAVLTVQELQSNSDAAVTTFNLFWKCQVRILNGILAILKNSVCSLPQVSRESLYNTFKLIATSSFPILINSS